MKKETVAPKPQVKKKGVIKKPNVQMVTYSIKMTIPTAAYANIIPEIVVKGGSIEEAHNFVIPHMNRLWKEYYLVNERRPEPVATQYPVPFPSTQIPSTSGVMMSSLENISSTTGTPIMTIQDGKIVPAPPASSVALIKATKAIESCLSVDALDIIDKQVANSVKLTDEDKAALLPLMEKKYAELDKPKE
jgi:hypothetical protein